jgi:hypothetical protein
MATTKSNIIEAQKIGQRPDSSQHVQTTQIIDIATPGAAHRVEVPFLGISSQKQRVDVPISGTAPQMMEVQLPGSSGLKLEMPFPGAISLPGILGQVNNEIRNLFI